MIYVNLSLIIVILGFVIGVYVHMDKKFDKLSNEMKVSYKELSNEMKVNYKELSNRIDKLSDRMDRLYDIQVHMGMGFRTIEQSKDKTANE